MVVHDELGRLLRPVGARIDPTAERLKPPLSPPVRTVPPAQSHAPASRFLIQVHGPSVVVGAPARPAGSWFLRLGDVVPARRGRGRMAFLAGTKGFVQQRHRELGLLLEKCREDGSAYYY